jgi:hypothetical protein
MLAVLFLQRDQLLYRWSLIADAFISELIYDLRLDEAAGCWLLVAGSDDPLIRAMVDESREGEMLDRTRMTLA